MIPNPTKTHFPSSSSYRSPRILRKSNTGFLGRSHFTLVCRVSTRAVHSDFLLCPLVQHAFNFVGSRFSVTESVQCRVPLLLISFLRGGPLGWLFASVHVYRTRCKALSTLQDATKQNCFLSLITLQIER